jgi:hypothetical protein
MSLIYGLLGTTPDPNYKQKISAVKRSKVLIHDTTWMNLENIILSERNQSQKATFCMILFI